MSIELTDNLNDKNIKLKLYNNQLIDEKKINNPHILEEFNHFCSFISGKGCCIKCYQKIFENIQLAKKILRELFIQKIVDSKYILKIEDILLPGNIYSFNTICYTTEKLKYSLRNMIISENVFNYPVKNIIYQIVSGVNALHKNKIVHRNLTSDSIYVNKNNEIRISEYGYSIINNECIDLKETIESNWYKAPEVLLINEYSEKSDMWAVGCIIYELITKCVLFRRQDKEEHIKLIAETIGKPPDLPYITFKQRFKLRKYKRNKYNWFFYFPDKFDDLLNLLTHLLDWDPNKRYSAEETLNHPYFSDINKLILKRKSSTSFVLRESPISIMQINNQYSDKNISVEEIKNRLVDEIKFYHPCIKT